MIALATAVEVEAPLLAADLGMTPYEAALMLRVPSPAPVLRTDDRARAIALLERLRARGHDAVACEVGAIASSETMTQLRGFRLEPDAFVLDAVATVRGPGDERRIPWGDIVALVRANHRTRTERIEKREERRLSLGRAALSGGLSVGRTRVNEAKVASEEREQVLYVFPSSGAPVFAAQSRVRYEGLGTALRPVQLENFATLVRVLRERALGAAYDERLLAPRPQIERVRTLTRGHETASSAAGVDLLAHLVAMAIARLRPYR